MPAPAPDPSHLVALIGAAREEAERLGPVLEPVARLLAEAAREARSASGVAGRVDEGVRLGELTTDNDK